MEQWKWNILFNVKCFAFVVCEGSNICISADIIRESHPFSFEGSCVRAGLKHSDKCFISRYVCQSFHLTHIIELFFWPPEGYKPLIRFTIFTKPPQCLKFDFIDNLSKLSS